MLCPTVISFLIKSHLYSSLAVRKKKITILSLVKKMAMVQRWPGADRSGGGLDDARVEGHIHPQEVSTTLNLGNPENITNQVQGPTAPY